MNMKEIKEMAKNLGI